MISTVSFCVFSGCKKETQISQFLILQLILPTCIGKTILTYKIPLTSVFSFFKILDFNDSPRSNQKPITHKQNKYPEIHVGMIGIFSK